MREKMNFNEEASSIKQSVNNDVVSALDVSALRVSSSWLAQFLGISPRWVQQMTKDGVLQQEAGGKYLLGKSVQAYILYKSGGSENVVANPKELLAERIKLTRAKAVKEDLEARLMEGELLDSEIVEDELVSMLNAFKTRIRAIPTKLAPRVLGLSEEAQVQAVMKGTIDEALKELSRYDPERTRKRSVKARGLVGSSTA